MDWPQATCYLNGEFTPLESAKISVLDRGFIFGDGVYEVVPVYQRTPFRLQQHLTRFERSLAETRIGNPHTREEWIALLRRLIATSEHADQLLYVQVTRGVAKRDFQFPPGVAPSAFAMTSPMTRPSREQREQGLRVVSKPDERWLRCDIKSVSLLGSVLARQYAVDRDAHEVVQFRDGFLTEASAANIWVVKNGVVAGPRRDNLILEGIRYAFIGELCAQAGVRSEERRILRDEVFAADELLITAATREVLPIVEIDSKPVGSGRPGPVYAKLRAGYDTAIEACR